MSAISSRHGVIGAPVGAFVIGTGRLAASGATAPAYEAYQWHHGPDREDHTMRVIAVALALVLWAIALPAFAQSISDTDKAAIRSTITNQLEAFKRDDGADAYSYAAPNVKAIFPTVEAFMGMVKQGYQPVYRPQSYAFKELAFKDGRLTQMVEIVGPDNDFWTAVYTVEQQPDGAWRITGCYLVKTPGGAA
jgi:hypothetical protein